MLKPLTLDCNKLWKALKEMEIPDHLTCLLRNLAVGQEETIRTLYGTTGWFKIEKGVGQVSAVILFVSSLHWAHHEKCWAGWVTNQNQDRRENHQQPQIYGWYQSNGRKWRGTKQPLDEGGREWKSQLKTKYLKKKKTPRLCHLAP